MPHRRRRAGSGAGAVCLCRGGQGGGRRRADRACAQGLAERTVAARKSRRAAARLCHRASAQARASRFRDRAQWRHRQPRAGASPTCARRRRDDGPRRLSGAVAAAGSRSAAVRRAGAVRLAERRGAGADALYRARDWPKACGCMPSPATCSACSAAFRARAPSAGIWRREAVKPGARASVMADALALVLDSNADLAHIAA